MQLMIPLTAVKLVLLTAVLWSTVSILAVIALCSIGYYRSFDVILRPTWPLIVVLAVTGCASIGSATYWICERGTFYGPVK
jgi:hypothetical protein